MRVALPKHLFYYFEKINQLEQKDTYTLLLRKK